jgi:hypothetical protein
MAASGTTTMTQVRKRETCPSRWLLSRIRPLE